MKAISQEAARTLERLIAGLGPHDSRVIGGPIVESGTGRAYMPVSVERLGDDQVSVAHYYLQNGDMMRDPEIVFWRSAGKWFPIEWTQDGLAGTVAKHMAYQRLVTFGDDGKPHSFMRRSQPEAATFTTTWMRNIRHQQSDWFDGREPSVDRIEGAALGAQVGTNPVTDPRTEAAMTDAEIWGPEAEAIWSAMTNAIKDHPRFGPLLAEVRPDIVSLLVSILASGKVPKRGYMVGPVGAPVAVEAPPRIPTPRQPTPRQPTPPAHSPAQAGQTYTREQAEEAVLSAWEAFKVARPDLFVV